LMNERQPQSKCIYTSTCTSTCMGTTSITISDDAYDFLKSIKGSRSFSETIIGLSRANDDIMRFAGIFRNSDLKGVENARKEINKDWNHRR
jgi:predicted CopG family antitoxin